MRPLPPRLAPGESDRYWVLPSSSCMLTRCYLGCALSTITFRAISPLKRPLRLRGSERKKIDQKMQYQALLTDSTASALLAISAPPPTLADSTASALLTIRAHPPVLADVGASAFLAILARPTRSLEAALIELPDHTCTAAASSM